MNRLADYHIHTFFSGDSEAKTDEIVKSAIEKGLSSICITDHLDFDYIVDDVLFELQEDSPPKREATPTNDNKILFTFFIFTAFY